MGNKIRIHLCDNFDMSLAPVPATRFRAWWEDNSRTKNHAKHCLPLSMANSLGYYIRSPGTFLIRWNGDHHSSAEIQIIEKSTHCEVDAHSAYGSFTVQPNFIPVTDDPGDFIYIKGIPNERSLPYTCMEACIEAWWNVGNFGLVFLLNNAGEFIINKGQPIAQMFLYHGLAGSAEAEFVEGYPEGNIGWSTRRYRNEYIKDLDYMRGHTHSGERIISHITNWKDSSKFRKDSDL